jgi:hypothetical protein
MASRASRDEIYIKAGKLEVRASGRMAVTAVIAFLAISVFVWSAGALTNLPAFVRSYSNGVLHRTDAAESIRAPRCNIANRHTLPPRSEYEAEPATQ